MPVELGGLARRHRHGWACERPARGHGQLELHVAHRNAFQTRRHGADDRAGTVAGRHADAELNRIRPAAPDKVGPRAIDPQPGQRQVKGQSFTAGDFELQARDAAAFRLLVEFSGQRSRCSACAGDGRRPGPEIHRRVDGGGRTTVASTGSRVVPGASEPSRTQVRKRSRQARLVRRARSPADPVVPRGGRDIGPEVSRLDAPTPESSRVGINIEGSRGGWDVYGASAAAPTRSAALAYASAGSSPSTSGRSASRLPGTGSQLSRRHRVVQHRLLRQFGSTGSLDGAVCPSMRRRGSLRGRRRRSPDRWRIVASPLFGGHVHGRADDASGLASSSLVQAFGQVEVGSLGVPSAVGAPFSA